MHSQQNIPPTSNQMHSQQDDLPLPSQRNVLSVKHFILTSQKMYSQRDISPIHPTTNILNRRLHQIFLKKDNLKKKVMKDYNLQSLQ